MFEHLTFRLLALIVSLFMSVCAHAQATRTWVSGVGDDVNPCSRTAPCKTFAGAISKTAAGGVINMIDSGGFGAVTITKSISIIGRGVQAGVLVSGTNGITVNVAANDSVYLDGLDIEGLGTGISGVNVIGGGKVFIRNSTIHHFNTGVNVMGIAGAKVVIENTFITGNSVGVNVAGQSGALNRAFLYDTTVETNSVASLQVGAGAVATLSDSKLQGAPASISNPGNVGIVESYGGNILRGAGGVTSVLTKF